MLRSPIKFRFQGNWLKFLSDVDDPAGFAALVGRALDVRAVKTRVLAWVMRTEFVVEGEIVPLFIDEDGSAHLEFMHNAPAVVDAVARRLRASQDFEEVQ